MGRAAARRTRSEKSPLRRWRLEQLEDRCVPATTVNLGDYYLYQGQPIAVEQYIDRLVVAVQPGAEGEVFAELTAPGGPLSGFTVSREPAPGVRIFAWPGTPMATGRQSSKGDGDKAPAAQPTIGPLLADGWWSLRQTEAPPPDLKAVRVAVEAARGVTWAAPLFQYAASKTDMYAGVEVIVGLETGVVPEYFFANPLFAGYRPLVGTPDQFVATLAHRSGEELLPVANLLEQSPDVAFASPNWYQDFELFSPPNDPLYPIQWHLNNTGAGGNTVGGVRDADIDAPNAWDINTGSNSIVVAVVDSGMQLNHPDLNIWVNPGEIAGNGIDDDGNGWIDDINGWDFLSNDNSPSTSNNDSHATSVAGIIAGTGNNGIGVSGASMGARVMSVKIFNATTFAPYASLTSAIYYAAGRTANGLGTWTSADIQNSSWGGGAPDTALSNAFVWASTNGRGGKGSPVFISSGNGDVADVAYPSELAGANAGIISVGGTDHTDHRFSGFFNGFQYGSQFGPELTIVAPTQDGNGGNGTVTTDELGSNGYNGLSDQSYTNRFGGTSSASPLAAGVGALMLSVNPNLTSAQVKSILKDSADKTGGYAYDATGFNIQVGFGRVNAMTALQFVQGSLSGRPEVQVFDGNTSLADGSAVVAFPGTYVSQPSSKTFTVYNFGSGTLTLNNPITVSAGFTLTSGFGTTSLGPGASTTFTVSADATAEGTYSGTVSFTNNDSDTTGPEDERTYNFQISAVVQTPSIAGAVFQDWDGDSTLDTGEPALANRRVYLDLNSNGVYDTNASSPTTTVINSTDVPKPIADFATTTSNNSVSGVGQHTVDVNITLNLTHTYDSDLKLTLISPSGTRVILAYGLGGANDNYTNTTFDDEAAASITSGSPPFSGTFRPLQLLSAFDTQNPNGIWKLEIVDNFPEDVGNLLSWSLTIQHSTPEPNLITAAQGFYAFAGLSAGTYTVRQVLPIGWSATSGPYTVVLTTGQMVTSQNFGSVRANAIYGHVFNDLNGDGTFGGAEPPLGGWTTYLDTNSNGVRETATASQSSTNVPINIDGSTVHTSILNVSGLSGQVTDINVTLNITHTWDSDLTATLISPTGARVELFSNMGFDLDNFTNTTLDDEAAMSITLGSAPFSGSFRPSGLLSNMDGEIPNGTWTLEIVDGFPQYDIGTLDAWSLTIQYSEPTSISDAAGQIAIANLSAGTYLMRQVNQSGWVQTAPPSGTYTVVLAAGSTDFGRNFGNRQSTAPVLQSTTYFSVDPNLEPGQTPSPHRSMIRQVRLIFDQAVFLDANAFAVDFLAGADPTLSVAGDGTNTVVLTFSGSQVNASGSLNDGNYQLQIVGARVHSGSIAGPGMVSDTTQNFHRYFGDSDGDRTVGPTDAFRFRQALGSTSPSDPNYRAYFDFNNDGAVSATDAFQFRQRLGTTLP